MVFFNGMKNKTKQLIIPKVRRHGHFTCERTTCLNLYTDPLPHPLSLHHLCQFM